MKTATHLALLIAVLSAVGAEIEEPVLPTAGANEFNSSPDTNSTLPENESLPNDLFFEDDDGEPVSVLISENMLVAEGEGALSFNMAEAEREGVINQNMPEERIEGDISFNMPVHFPLVQKSDVFYKLYTRDGPAEGEIIELGVEDSLRNSSFNGSQHTFLVTHGFIQSIESNTIRTIRNMYVPNEGGNFIAVDWSKISKTSPYAVAKIQTYHVGELVGAFVAFLVNKGGADPSNIHLCGHNLGAHVMGVAGKNVSVTLGRKVGRITGLDPAGPLFSVKDKEHRLDRSDAEFVDVIHTCGGGLGLMAPIGHADFYPNGGTAPQPGCPSEIELGRVCSHSRSWEFYAESILSHRFSSTACSSYEDYLRKNCNNATKVPMGEHTPKGTLGTYYLRTAAQSPFALG